MPDAVFDAPFLITESNTGGHEKASVFPALNFKDRDRQARPDIRCFKSLPTDKALLHDVVDSEAH